LGEGGFVEEEMSIVDEEIRSDHAPWKYAFELETDHTSEINGV